MPYHPQPRRSRDRQPSAVNRLAPVINAPQTPPQWEIIAVFCISGEARDVLLFHNGQFAGSKSPITAGLVIGAATVFAINSSGDGWVNLTAQQFDITPGDTVTAIADAATGDDVGATRRPKTFTVDDVWLATPI